MLDVVWQPHPGSQRAFLECPFWDVLYHGTRGPGKTDALLMDYAQHVGAGFGPAWRGVLFRRTYKQLADVIARAKRWYPRIFPGARYNASEYTWTFPHGEQLLMRYMRVADDYWEYHGHEYPWIGWEEITRWPNGDCMEMMTACSRSSVPGMPRKIRATANPYGIGHAWVKEKYQIGSTRPCQKQVVETDAGTRLTRTHIFGDITENTHMMEADPDYINRLDGLSDPNLRKAWRLGSWDIVAGGALDDVWDRDVHVTRPFVIPSTWHVDRGFDWGSSAPFSVLWFAEADGSEFDPRTGRGPELGGGASGPTVWYPKGTLFAIREWYGDDGKENGIKLSPRDIAEGVKDRESSMEDAVSAGPADTAIWDAVPGSRSIAEQMEARGVSWTRADKSPGSRVQGLTAIRDMLEAAKLRPPEDPGLYVWDTCPRLISHIAVLERDEKNMEDVDTDQPDHDYDVVRYRVRAGVSKVTPTEVV